MPFTEIGEILALNVRLIDCFMYLEEANLVIGWLRADEETVINHYNSQRPPRKCAG